MEKKDISLEHYRKIRNYMSVEGFRIRFTELFNEWKKDRPGREGTKKKLGDLIGVSDETINNWLRGKSKVSEDIIFKKLCEDGFQCDPETFAPELRFLPMSYPAGQEEQIKKGISSRDIDLNFLNYVTRNFQIPHPLSQDPFVLPDANRQPAPQANVGDPLVVHQGDKKYYVDDQDLDIVAALQKRIAEIIQKTFDEQYKDFESDYLKWIVPLSFGRNLMSDTEKDQRDFEYRTQCIVYYCPHLDAADIVSMMEKKWKMKYTRKSLTDLLDRI